MVSDRLVECVSKKGFRPRESGSSRYSEGLSKVTRIDEMT